MKLPETINVLGKVIPVELKELGEDVLGDTDGEAIYISTKAKKSDWKGILLHEMWHCYERRSGLFYMENHDVNIEEIRAEGFANIISENFILRARR